MPGVLGIGFHQLDLLVVAAGKFQIIDGLLIDVEHGRRGAVFRRHVRDGGAVDQGQAGCAFAVEFQIRSGENTSELLSLMRITYAVFTLKKKRLTNSYISLA